ncbi:unnamed protein product, partial [Prorocentrum cordatum]
LPADARLHAAAVRDAGVARLRLPPPAAAARQALGRRGDGQRAGGREAPGGGDWRQVVRQGRRGPSRLAVQVELAQAPDRQAQRRRAQGQARRARQGQAQ